MSRFNLFLTVLVCVTAVAHFLVATSLSTTGFVFKDLKSRLKDLSSERQTMESTISSLASYQSLNPRIASLNLVATDEVHYLSWNQYIVAKK
jgi:hypothetical protein